MVTPVSQHPSHDNQAHLAAVRSLDNHSPPQGSPGAGLPLSEGGSMPGLKSANIDENLHHLAGKSIEVPGAASIDQSGVLAALNPPGGGAITMDLIGGAVEHLGPLQNMDKTHEGTRANFAVNTQAELLSMPNAAEVNKEGAGLPGVPR